MCSKGRQLVSRAFPEITGWLCSKTAVNLSFLAVKITLIPAHPLTHTMGRWG